MIQIDYSNGIKITTGDLKGIFTEDQLPLNFKIKASLSKKIIWETNLLSNMWATYPNSEMNNVCVYDANGKFIYCYYWDVMVHGSIFYKSLWLHCFSICNSGRIPKGLVIGTHDGEFGEWVPVYKNYLSEMVLVEGSEQQFNKLQENITRKNGIKLIHDIITTDGGDVEFFEGGAGYTNTVVKRVIDYWEKEEVHSTKRKSTSINSLIKQNFDKLDWLHLDVEGLDAKLIMSLEDVLIPPFIIFEDFNLEPGEKTTIFEWLKSRGFSLHSEGGICMAKK